jgi:hypothetical protein
MGSALYPRMSFLDNQIPHLIAEMFPGKATSIDLTYITKRETERERDRQTDREREQLPFGAHIPATKYKIKLLDKSFTKYMKSNSGIRMYLKSIQQAHRIRKFCPVYRRINTQKCPKQNRPQ